MLPSECRWSAPLPDSSSHSIVADSGSAACPASALALAAAAAISDTIVLMRRERDAARGDAEERRQPKDTRWFVVHQRDGTPMVDIFIEQGAERAAKLTARFYAAQWTDVYVMTGRPVSSADFEAEATEERAERAADKATS